MTPDYALTHNERLSEAYRELEESGELEILKEVMDVQSCREKVLDVAERELDTDAEARVLIDRLHDAIDRLNNQERLASDRLYWHYFFFCFAVHFVGCCLFFFFAEIVDNQDRYPNTVIPIGLAVTFLSFFASFYYCNRYANDTFPRQSSYILPSVLAYLVVLVIAGFLVFWLIRSNTETGIAILILAGLPIFLVLILRARISASSIQDITASVARKRETSLAGLAETSRELYDHSLIIVQNAKRTVEKEQGVQKFEPWVPTLPRYEMERPARYLVERYEYYFPNYAFERLRQYIEQHDKGSIGLAGERGIGKTSLMRGLRTWFRQEKSRECLSIWISSPTAFDEKEFLLSVLAQLATTVGAKLTGNSYWPRQPPASELEKEDRASRWNVLFLTATAITMVISGTLYALSERNIHGTEEEQLFRVFVLLSFCVPGLWLFAKLFRALSPRRLDCRSNELRPYVAASIQLLEELWYERKEVQVTNFSLSYFGTAIRGRTGSEKTREPFTLPHLVEIWDKYLELIAGPGKHFQKVIVFIDELDKIPNAESIGKFLLVLKSLYDPDNLFFVISISDDAYRLFQTRRSMHRRRNEFDSSVGHVERITNMNHAEVCGLLEKRVLGPKLPHPATLLVWVLSEGNPRDVVRIARSLLDKLTEVGETPNYWDIARTLWFQRFGRGFSDPQWAIFTQEDPELAKSIRCYDESFKPTNVQSLLQQAITDIEGLSSQSLASDSSDSKAEAREYLLVKLWYALVSFDLFCTDRWEGDPNGEVKRLARLHCTEQFQVIDRILAHQSNAAPRQAVQLLREFHSKLAVK